MKRLQSHSIILYKVIHNLWNIHRNDKGTKKSKNVYQVTSITLRVNDIAAC